MKLLRLDLLAVGPFTGVSLDLSAGDPGLHVVVGPNEAGKSSALRALTALLYGFGVRTAGEDAVHKATDVRVGGLLRHSDGTELAVVRRRGNVRTLLSPDGQPLPDDALARFLGTVDAAAFQGFFGLGHDTLRAGNEDLLRTDGRVGQALFAAGAGGKPLRVALDRYVQQAEQLYKPSGKNQALPQAAAEHKLAMEAMRAASRPPEDWDAQQAAHAAAQTEADRVAAELAEVNARRAEADRVRRAIPLLAERSAVLAQLAAVVDAPRLPSDFAARRAATEQARSATARAATDARRALESVTTELAGLTVPESLLVRADAVDVLYQRLGAYQQAVTSMPDLRVKLDAALAAVRRLIADLRPDAPPAADAAAVLMMADELRLGTARRARIQALSAEFEQLSARASAARDAAANAAVAKQRLAAELSMLPPPVDVSAVDAAVRSATRAGDLDEAVADARAAEARLRAKVEADRRSLPLFTGTLDELEALPAPAAESIQAAEREQATAETRRQRAADQLRTLAQRHADLARDLDAMRLAGHVPTEAELAAAREARDATWADIRRQGMGDHAEVYEAAVRKADAIADGLRRESARVAQQATLQADKTATEAALRDARDRVAAAGTARAAADERWRALWTEAGIDPLTPAEMRDWLGRRRDLCRAYDAVRDATAAVASLAAQWASHRQTVAAALGRSSGDGPLGPLVEHGRAVVDAARAADERRRRTDDALRRASDDADRLSGAAAATAVALNDWQARWATAVQGLGLPAGAGPVEARATVDRCDELDRAATEARQLSARLDATAAEAARFTGDAAALAADLLPGGAAASPVDAATALRRAVEAAQRSATQRQALQRRRAEAATALRRAESAEAAAVAELADLCRRAGCDPEGLPEVERRADLRRRLEDQLRTVEQQVLTVNLGEAIESLADAVAATDADAAAARMADLEATAHRLDEQRRSLHEQVGRAAEKLAAWDGGGAAADAADRAAAVLAKAREAAARYVRLRLAAGVLRHGIDRHRQRRQAPLLSRASQLFAGLTLGSFQALAADLTDGDEPVLVGVRPGGRRVTVAEMSDGARDQLYLSLRLAALEDFVARNEPVPLVVDDVLVHFDDARSCAALAALCELSRKTQVVLFTHHQHVADLAAVAEPGQTRLHRL